MALYKIPAAFKPTATLNTFVGEQGEFFYSEDDPRLRISDGETPGGIIVTVDSAGSDIDLSAVSQSIVPAEANVYDLGAEGYEWRDLHLSGNTLIIGGKAISIDPNTNQLTLPSGSRIENSDGTTSSIGPRIAMTVTGAVDSVTDLDNIANPLSGDFYIVSSNGNGYVRNGDEWSNVGNLQGDVGFTGSSGFVGSQGDVGFTGSSGFVGSQGEVGFVGSQGEVGFVGSQGDIGFTGSFGFTGSSGFVGSQGEIGFTGSQGDIGFTGSFGYTGSQGDIGFTGSQGDIGFTGSFGYTGSQGDIGFTGSFGYTGSQGDIGYTGSQGDIGFTGSFGYTGSQGDIGFTGSFGFTGSQGDIGFTGSFGFTGSNGFTGSQGDIGFTGSFGYTGSQGDIGFTGSSGFVGSQGEVGFVGSQGEVGFVGSQGEVGFVGSNGVDGFTGSQGDIGFTGSAGTSIVLKGAVDTVSDLDNIVNPEVGDFYVVSSVGEGYVWNGTNWENTGSIQGPTGFAGSIGFTGSQGDAGFTGSTGFTGSIGFTGSQGDAGFTGSTGFTGSEGRGIQSVNIENDDLIITYTDSEENNLGPIAGGSSDFDATAGNGIKFTTADTLTEISLDETADVEFQSLSLAEDGFIQFQDGTRQSTTAPRFFYESFEYQQLKDAGEIIPGDYLYDYTTATLFVTTFVPFNGWVTNKGFGYAPGQFFVFETDVELIGGSGTGATVDALIFFGQIFTVTLKNPGSGYSIGDSLTVDLGDGGSGFEVILNSVDLATGEIKDGDTTLFDITVY